MFSVELPYNNSTIDFRLENHVDRDRILSDQYIEDILVWSLVGLLKILVTV